MKVKSDIYTFSFILQPPIAIFFRAGAFSSPVLYAVGMAEKGRPCARRLGVATETTGVVRVGATWAPAASRWAFCQDSTKTCQP